MTNEAATMANLANDRVDRHRSRRITITSRLGKSPHLQFYLVREVHSRLAARHGSDLEESGEW